MSATIDVGKQFSKFYGKNYFESNILYIIKFSIKCEVKIMTLSFIQEL